MNPDRANLESILNKTAWQNLQDSLAKAMGIAIITVDYKGTPFSSHSGCTDFCKCMRSDDNTRTLCEKCDSRGGLEAARSEEPFVYLCHSKIVDVALPIIVNDRYVGALMAGQVRLSNPKEEKLLENIVSVRKMTWENDCELERYYSDIPEISYSQLNLYIDTLYNLCKYIAATAAFIDEHPKFSSVSGNIAMNTQPQSNFFKVKTSISPLLQPFFDYIETNAFEMISQKKAADICKISPGYFSRLFYKETGEIYSNYFSHQKVEWAKKLLRKTDLNISQISEKLGFSEPSYFVKVFKKFETITPSAFRKLDK